MRSSNVFISTQYPYVKRADKNPLHAGIAHLTLFLFTMCNSQLVSYLQILDILVAACVVS